MFIQQSKIGKYKAKKNLIFIKCKVTKLFLQLKQYLKFLNIILPTTLAVLGGRWKSGKKSQSLNP